MTGVRLLRWFMLLTGLIASITWSYVAIDHLLDSSLNSQQRMAAYHVVPEPVSGHIQQMQTAQMRWGRQSLFAVACSFLMLLFIAVNWVLDGRVRQPRIEPFRE